MSETAEMPIMDSECPFRHELNPYSNLGDSTARTNYFIFQAGMKTGFREAEKELTKLRGAVSEMSLAIKEIAPWLSASLNELCCKEYEAACEEIFRIDLSSRTKN
jgi:hypothetical protein